MRPYVAPAAAGVVALAMLVVAPLPVAVALLAAVLVWRTWPEPQPAALPARERRESVLVARPDPEPWDADPELGLVLVDGDDLVRQASERAIALLALTGPVCGRALLTVGPPPELLSAVEAARTGDLGAADVKGVADLVLHPVRLDDGAVLVVVEDRGPLVEAERSRTDFVANVSHELRTPLAAVMGFAEAALLERDRVPPDVADSLDALGRNALRLRDLFAALLRLHRIEMRRRDLPLEPLPVAPILRGAVVDAEAAARAAGIAFSVACDASLVALVQDDALATAVANLAGNAVRYTPAGGSVAVRAHAVDDEVVVEVVDNGIGIDPVHHERVFERFYRVDEGRGRADGGSGIGLAMVKHLCRAAGWKLGLESAPGRGSTFRVHLLAAPRS
jgi:signal transduction histidine kinase